MTAPLLDRRSPLLPRYRGLEWIAASLPTNVEPWPQPPRKRLAVVDDGYDENWERVREYVVSRPWIWPNRSVYLFTDVHADADAFATSLVASGGVAKHGPEDRAISLTEEGKRARFIISGDCFDKGPSNLRLIRMIGHLLELGADLELLAGNHDLRTLVGIRYLGSRDPRHAHLFVRMGKKSIPLFREIWNDYLAHDPPAQRLSDGELAAMMFPDEQWYQEFPRLAAGLVPEKKLRKELARIREKIAEFQAKCEEMGMSLWQVYAAVEKARALFAEPTGEFAWFFERMKLATRHGSFLFVHAGLDDTTASVLRTKGVEGLNRWYSQLVEQDLFTLYHGPLGNCFRTKYRDIDFVLSPSGIADVHAAGVYAIVHGHMNITKGQRMVLRGPTVGSADQDTRRSGRGDRRGSGPRVVLNFECDASIDRNTRRIEGIEGPGGAVTVLRPEGRLFGISTDHPTAKVFEPTAFGAAVTIV